MGLTWGEVVDRFWNLRSAKGGGKCRYHGYSHYRDEVEVEDGVAYYYLHRVCIAKYHSYANILEIDHQGYNTPTTRDRLNAIARFGSVSLTVIGMLFFPKGSDFAYAPPIVVDLETGKVLNYRKEYYIVPKISNVKGRDYITIRVNGDTYVVHKSGKIFKVLKSVMVGMTGERKVRYYKYYGEYICERVGGLPS